MPELDAAATTIIVLSGLYLVWLGALSLAAPIRAKSFLDAFASSARAHYLELGLRLLIGAAFLVQAPAMLHPSVFQFVGWALLLTTAPLLLLPWRWHQRIAERAVPYATAHLRAFGSASALLGMFVLVSLVGARLALPPGSNLFLLAGAMLSAMAAVLHLGCVYFGAPWYRLFGAGEKMALLAEAGSSYPARVTLLLALVLFAWSAYALSGAGLIPRLPLLAPVLCLITAVYLIRGFAFLPLMKLIPGNSLAFWLWSAAICAVIGVVHALGLWQAWGAL